MERNSKNERMGRINLRALAMAALCALVLSVGVGCAHAPQGATTQTRSVRLVEPGTIFPTVEEAIIHALAYGQGRVLELPASQRRLQGGTIRTKSGGYTFDVPVMASADARFAVEYALTSDTVAHYRIQPEMGLSDANRTKALERLNAHDRAMVDRHDPRHRPFYLLTPKMNVKEYGGSEHGTRRVARMRVEREAAGAEVLVWVDSVGFGPSIEVAAN